MLPTGRLASAYVWRGARLWLIARVLLCAVFLVAGTNPFKLSAAAAAGIVVLSVVLGFGETHIRRESVFLANMGLRPAFLGAIFAVPATIGEVALHLVGAAI
jgi:hypothetical protein